MAVLHNEAKTLRFFMEMVDREVPAIVPGQPLPSPESIRSLGTAGVEFFDRRDQSFWPFLRLPVVYFGGNDGPELIRSAKALCSQQVEGFVFRSGATQELALQLARQTDGRFLVEVGIDLAPYLLETAGRSAEQGHELALYRFTTTMADVVRFADQVKQELDQLPPVRRGAAALGPA